MPSQRVVVSYSASPAFISSANWTEIYNALQSQLPLRNIHWKPASRSSIRTIQELDVNLLQLDKIRDEHTSQIPVTLLEKPLLNIYIVNCEDNELEVYRTRLKKQIKEWHSMVTARKNQEWLILHIVRPDSRTQGGTFFQLKGSVIDRLRADFNTEKKERCIQLNWASGNINPTAWGEFVNKLKDGILAAFDSAVVLREEEVKRSESQRQLPGWNFCTFFILKECLATSFAGVNLFDDALVQYDELEASFYQVLKEKNLSWFGTLISPSAKDDSAPLLSISKKPYRDLIVANTISVFDFRIYLLARQCDILGKQGRMTEVCRKVGAFLGAFGRRLRGIENTLPKFFVESWTYSSALSVVEQCDIWASSLNLEGSKLATFNAGKAELLELARDQLDILGIQIGHLPAQPPFSMVFPSTPTSPDTKSRDQISNAELLAALDNQETFFVLYIGITNQAIDMYAKGGRRKFALKLHGSLAALDLHRGRLDVALTTYTSLPAHYAPHMWTSLESRMLSKALDIHASLEKPHDTEWIHILLSFLKTYVEGLGTELLMREEDKVQYVSKLVNEMQVASSTLDADLAHPDHPALQLDVAPNARSAGDKDGSYLDVTVRNDLPCTLPINEVSVTLAGRDTEKLRFSLAVDQLPPGKTKMTLFCPTSPHGTYLFESSEVRVCRLLLQWSHRKKPTIGRHILIRIPKDILALDVTIHQPKHIELGKPPAILLNLSTGRNHILRASVKLSTSSNHFYHKRASLEPETLAALETSDESAILTNLGRDTTVSVLVPHSDASAFHAMKVLVEVEYVTESEPSLDRLLRTTRTVVTALPISVNVEDFFRGQRLFSKFTVSTTGPQHVRISEAHLEPPIDDIEGLSIVSCSSEKRGVVTVTPTQPANFLFYIDSSEGPIREPLTLRIRYRMLREEVESVIEEAVASVLTEMPSLTESRLALISNLVDTLEFDASWVEVYGLCGELNVPTGRREPQELSEALSRVKKVLSGHQTSATGPWHEIRIPVDVPNMNIVAAAGIKIVAGEASHELPALYAGQPIDALLTIHTSFHWGSSTNPKDKQYMMQFDVDEMVRDWLVSGKKRGDFMALHDATYSIPITLIALHHGELALPKVNVSASPLVGELTMGSMAIPNTEAYQAHGAEKVMVLPRGGRSTFLVGMG
ncbi:trafficking protein particle complex subunit 10 [Mycena floridula]|nr:trafficking protein particle complex subunit 10 [Mycena floridula]